VIRARWQRADPDRPFALVDVAGRRVPLKPGNTWVVLTDAKPRFNP
jgi:hypothetical protein